MTKNRRSKLIIALIMLIISSISSLSAQGDTTRVLFVGNSFTYFFNLPQVLTSMAASQAVIIETRQSTVGGSNLEQHWKNEKGTITRKMLEENKYDYVVFNNHSTSSIDSPDSFMEYGKKFADLVKSKGAKPIFMVTWAYKSNPLMQTRITEMYNNLCAETNADYVPAGPLFAEARKWRPDMNLFHDDKHPSSNGTYLIGLCFFKYFTGLSTSAIPARLTTLDRNDEKLYLLFMDQADADFLHQLVNEYAIKSLK
jgi:hypothetical protein